MLTAGKQDFKLVGYLNSIEDIIINMSGEAYIKLTTISDLPESIDINDFYSSINVYVSKFNTISLYDNMYDADDVRVQHIWDELSSLLIEGTPDVKADKNRPNKYWWWGDRIRVQKMNESFHFLMAARPNRMAAPTGVKYRSLSFTSGGSTVIPIPRASLMYLTTFSVFPVSDVSSAAMNSTG